MRQYTVYLYRAPDCTRCWLAYLTPDETRHRATFHVKLEAKNGADAKNKAITRANKQFDGLEIMQKNYDDSLWGINNFPDLLEQFPCD